MRRMWLRVPFLLFLLPATAHATIFGTVRGTVRDATGAPVAGAVVTLRAEGSTHLQSATTDRSGAFRFPATPIGSYRIAAADRQTQIDVTSAAVINVTLTVGRPALSESVTVTAAAPEIDMRSPTTQTTVNHREITETPGAERSNSLAMITEFVPGAYVVHDQLHVRGGHQVDWLVDGVPVPNTNIASNVGPQFDPKDVDVLEVQRGGYSAEYGDRTYGVFNVVPRTGFARDHDVEVIAGYGSQSTTNDQVSIGDHTERFAHYFSINGNRTDLGLETPVPSIIHDSANGLGAFATLVFLPTSADQLRFVGSWRRDRYLIPNDEDLEAANVNDVERERDVFLNVSWVRVVSPSTLLTLSPFAHENSADFEGGPSDPIVATDRRDSRYAGAQATLAGTFGRNEARLGVFGFAQRDDVRFSVQSEDAALSEQDRPTGSVRALFAEDALDLTPWLTLRAGIRLTRFDGGIAEHVASPRIGATARLPWDNAVVRASYGHYYQAPPLTTVSGPLLQFAADQGFGFLPLRGERDKQSEIGVLIPIAGWTADVAAFRTEARNFFDHDVLGNSDIFFPLTIDRVHIRGIESTLRSPSIGPAQFHLAYSHQTVEGEGAVSGGLTDFTPPDEGRYFLDHDQRDTLAAGVTIRLPRSSWIGGNVNYGSGFLAGDGPAHLPSHATFDLGLGTVLKNWTVKLSATNVTNKRYLLDESNTFGGTHWADPRQVSLEARYRFRY